MLLLFGNLWNRQGLQQTSLVTDPVSCASLMTLPNPECQVGVRPWFWTWCSAGQGFIQYYKGPPEQHVEHLPG